MLPRYTLLTFATIMASAKAHTYCITNNQPLWVRKNGFSMGIDVAKKTMAIVLAAGSGRRMGIPLAKQFLPLGGVPLVAHSLLAFQNSPIIDAITLVVAEKDATKARVDIVERFGISKCSRVVVGGKERQDSVGNALAHLDGNFNLVVIHDGVRIFIRDSLIAASLEAAQEYGASAVGIPLKDTVKQIDGEAFVVNTPPREHFWLIQTPQAFRYEVITAAYEMAFREGFYATDDAALVERLGLPVKMVPGTDDNIKITTTTDLLLARALRGEREMMSVGFGYDSHRFVTNRDLWLGGVRVPFAKGLAGHSDADVLLHALIDAIIGALGSGDIGKFFPDTDARYKDVQSSLLLGEIMELVKARGLLVGNIDTTVVLEEPYLRPFIETMRESIAGIVGVPRTCVNIKAKSNEGMGFVGRGEGIAAFAIVTLKEG